MKIKLFYDHHIDNLRKWVEYDIDTNDLKEACYQAVTEMYPWIKKREHYIELHHAKVPWAGEIQEWDSIYVYNDGEPLPGSYLCPIWLKTSYWIAVQYKIVNN